MFFLSLSLRLLWEFQLEAQQAPEQYLSESLLPATILPLGPIRTHMEKNKNRAPHLSGIAFSSIRIVHVTVLPLGGGGRREGAWKAAQNASEQEEGVSDSKKVMAQFLCCPRIEGCS